MKKRGREGGRKGYKRWENVDREKKGRREEGRRGEERGKEGCVSMTSVLPTCR